MVLAQDPKERTTERSLPFLPSGARKHRVHSRVFLPWCGAHVVYSGEPSHRPRMHRDANGHQRQTPRHCATLGALALGSVVVQTPGGDVLALAMGIREWTSVPPEPGMKHSVVCPCVATTSQVCQYT